MASWYYTKLDENSCLNSTPLQPRPALHTLLIPCTEFTCAIFSALPEKAERQGTAMAVYFRGHAAGHSPWCILPKGYSFDVWKVRLRVISAADRLYDEHIKQLRKEGLIP